MPRGSKDKSRPWLRESILLCLHRQMPCSYSSREYFQVLMRLTLMYSRCNCSWWPVLIKKCCLSVAVSERNTFPLPATHHDTRIVALKASAARYPLHPDGLSLKRREAVYYFNGLSCRAKKTKNY